MSTPVEELKSKYSKFVVNNHEVVGSIETASRVLSYVFPGKSPAISELLYSASNLLVLWNDAILRKASGIRIKVPIGDKTIATWLTVVEYLEVFLEIGAQEASGPSLRWAVVVLVQLLKSCLRLLLLLKHNTGIQQSPLLPPLRRTKLTQAGRQKAAKEKEEQQKLLSLEPETKHSMTFTLQRSGKVVRTLSATPPFISRTWKLPEEKPEEINEKNEDRKTQTVLTRRQLIGECLYILRPLIHLLSMYRYGQNSWRQWIVAAFCDVYSLRLMGDKSRFNRFERKELSRRKIMLLLYLLRSPLYDKHTKVRLIAALNVLGETIPGSKYIINPLLDYLPYWQKVYFYVWMS